MYISRRLFTPFTPLNTPMLAALAALATLATCHGAAGARASAPRAPAVTVTVSLMDDAALQLHYALPPACTALPFVNQGIRPEAAAEMRRDWVAQDDCTELDGQAIRVRAGCSSARIKVPAAQRDLDRVYPWAQLLHAGIYSHTSAFALTPACGALQWRFGAPDGDGDGDSVVIVDGKPWTRPGKAGAAQVGLAYVPLLFLRVQDGAARASLRKKNIDARFPPETVAFLDDTMSAVRRQYRASLPGVAFPLPYLSASVIDGNRFRGDVANRSTLRLALPPAPNAEQKQTVRRLVAHEVAHLLQPARLDQQAGGNATAISEGGAEFLAWHAAAQLGWLDGEQLAAQVGDAINLCLGALGGSSWNKADNRDWHKTPYQCGMMLHVLALADRGARQAPALLLRDYYRDLGRGRASGFAQALECGKQAHCRPRWLTRLLESDEPVAAVVADYGVATGLLAPSTQWDEARIVAVARWTMGQLMAADCDGQQSFYTLPDHVRIGPVRACKNLREGMAIVEAQGLKLFSERGAAAALSEACKTSGTARLGLQDGASLTLACPGGLAAAPLRYSVNGPLLLARLGLGPGVDRGRRRGLP